MKLKTSFYYLVLHAPFLFAQEQSNLEKLKDYSALLKHVAALPIELQEHIGSYYYADLKDGKNYIPSINAVYQIKKLPSPQDIARDTKISEKEKQKRINYWQDLRTGNFSYYKGPLHKFLDFLDRKLKTKPNQGDWATLCYKGIPLVTLHYGSIAEQELYRGDSDTTIFGPNSNGLIIDNRCNIHLLSPKNKWNAVKSFLFRMLGKSHTSCATLPRRWSWEATCLNPSTNKFIAGSTYESGYEELQEYYYDSDKKVIIPGKHLSDQAFKRLNQLCYDPLELEKESLLGLSNSSLYSIKVNNNEQAKTFTENGTEIVSTVATNILGLGRIEKARMHYSRKFPHLMIINGTKQSFIEEDKNPTAVLFSRNPNDNLKNTYENLSQGGIGFCQKPDVGPVPENIVCFTSVDKIVQNFPQAIENARQELLKYGLLTKAIAKEFKTPQEIVFCRHHWWTLKRFDLNAKNF
jgi:hypothetical protein